MAILNKKEELAVIKMEIDSIISLLVLIQDSSINNEYIDIDSLLLTLINSLIEINKSLTRF